MAAGERKPQKPEERFFVELQARGGARLLHLGDRRAPGAGVQGQQLPRRTSRGTTPPPSPCGANARRSARPPGRGRELVWRRWLRPLRSRAWLVVTVAATGAGLRAPRREAAAGGDRGRGDGADRLLRAQLQPAARGRLPCAGRPAGRCTSRCSSTTRCWGNTSPGWPRPTPGARTASSCASACAAGVAWSDGAPFGARDVVFTFELLRRYPGPGRRAACGSTSPPWPPRGSTPSS